MRGPRRPPPCKGGAFETIWPAGRTPAGWRDAMYYRYYDGSPQRPAHFGVRTHQHKLICYDGLKTQPEEQRWELYDLAQDPQETRNAYGDAAYAEIVTQLKARLRELQTELGDQP